jgi:hypothetical protein
MYGGSAPPFAIKGYDKRLYTDGTEELRRRIGERQRQNQWQPQPGSMNLNRPLQIQRHLQQRGRDTGATNSAASKIKNARPERKSRRPLQIQRRLQKSRRDTRATNGAASEVKGAHLKVAATDSEAKATSTAPIAQSAGWPLLSQKQRLGWRGIFLE